MSMDNGSQEDLSNAGVFWLVVRFWFREKLMQWYAKDLFWIQALPRFLHRARNNGLT